MCVPGVELLDVAPFMLELMESYDLEQADKGDWKPQIWPGEGANGWRKFVFDCRRIGKPHLGYGLGHNRPGHSSQVIEKQGNWSHSWPQSCKTPAAESSGTKRQMLGSEASLHAVVFRDLLSQAMLSLLWLNTTVATGTLTLGRFNYFGKTIFGQPNICSCTRLMSIICFVLSNRRTPQEGSYLKISEHCQICKKWILSSFVLVKIQTSAESNLILSESSPEPASACPRTFCCSYFSTSFNKIPTFTPAKFQHHENSHITRILQKQGEQK